MESSCRVGSHVAEHSLSAAHLLENRGRKNRDRERSRWPKAVPSGTTLNWIDALGTGRGAGPGGGDATSVQAEVTLSATGRMQGAVSKGVLTPRMRWVAVGVEPNVTVRGTTVGRSGGEAGERLSY